MSLTDGEAHRLREIEAALAREDPMLSKALAKGRPKDERSYRIGKIILLVSFPVLTVGSAVQQPELCVGAWLGLLVGGLLVLGHVLATVGPPPSSRGPG